jgi:hypothetical protein
MKTITKLLTLTPLLALAAACNGLAPTSPSDLAASDVAAVVATADTSKGVTPSVCKSVADVRLAIVPSPKGILNIRATYVGIGSATSRCPGPSWVSDFQGILVPYKDPFLVGVGAFDTDSVTVTATAPNGVTGSITIKRPPQVTNSAVPACKSIASVGLTIVPGADNITHVKATYVSLGGSQGRCPAPAWTSNPRGVLAYDKDLFKVGVRPSAAFSVTVTATAPNGVSGQIKIGS